MTELLLSVTVLVIASVQFVIVRRLDALSARLSALEGRLAANHRMRD